MSWAALGAALALLAASPTLAAPPAPEHPYSCRPLDDTERKCAFGAFDKQYCFCAASNASRA